MNSKTTLNWVKNTFSKKIVRDSVWLLLSQAILASCGILINIIITKKYGVSLFGSFSISLKIYLVASIFSTLGIGVPALKYSAQYSGNRIVLNKSMSAAIILVVFISLLISAILFYFTPIILQIFSYNSLPNFLPVLFVSLPIYSLNKVLLLMLNGQRNIKAVSIIQIMRWSLIITIISVCAFLNFKIIFLGYAFLITEVILLVGIWIYKNNFFSFSFSIDKFWLKEYFSFGGKSMFSYAITDIYNYLDIFILGLFSDARVVGIYSFASDISKNLLVIADIFFTNFNPIFTTLYYKKQYDELKIQIRKIRNLTYIIYVPLIITSIIIYYGLIKWMKSDLEDSFVPFVILSIGVFLFSGIKPFMAVLEFAGFPGEKLKLSVLILFVNLILIVIFNFYWSVNGVAFATTLTYVILVLFLHLSAKRKLKISLLSY